jgi:hypothetical protein
MSAAEFAALVKRVEAGTATREDRAAYVNEIVGQAGIDGYSLTARRPSRVIEVA